MLGIDMLELMEFHGTTSRQVQIKHIREVIHKPEGLTRTPGMTADEQRWEDRDIDSLKSVRKMEFITVIM
jgi:hypothetical protein